VTPQVVQRKRHRFALKKSRAEKNKTEAAAYAKLIASRLANQRAKKAERTSKRRQERLSQVSAGSASKA